MEECLLRFILKKMEACLLTGFLFEVKTALLKMIGVNERTYTSHADVDLTVWVRRIEEYLNYYGPARLLLLQQRAEVISASMSTKPPLTSFSGEPKLEKYNIHTVKLEGMSRMYGWLRYFKSSYGRSQPIPDS